MTVWSTLVGESEFAGMDYWRYFGVQLVQRAGEMDGYKVLDVGCGDGGSSLLPAVEEVGPGGWVIGLDSWPGCAEGTRDLIKARGLENAGVVLMAAEEIGFPDEFFDRVVSGFVGWGNIFDFERGEYRQQDVMMAEIRRVLKPGGVFHRSTWENQADIEFMTQAYFRHLPYALDGLRDEKLEQDWHFYSKENAAGEYHILAQGGFEDVSVSKEAAEFVVPDEEAFWALMGRVGFRGHFGRLESLGEDKLARLKENVFEDLRAHKGPDGIRFTKTVMYMRGRKPMG